MADGETRPFRPDHLTRITNVQWGGATFVLSYNWSATNPENNIYTNATIPGQPENWKKTYTAPGWGSPDGVQTGKISATPWPGGAAWGDIPADTESGTDKSSIFVIVGRDSGVGVGAQSPGYIITSKDGKNWDDIIKKADVAEFYVVTWNDDDKAFYAGMIDLGEIYADLDEPKKYDVAYKSEDGLKWTEVARQEWTSEPDKRTTSPVEQYCSDAITDKNGNKTPTSVFGYDKGGDVLIAPDPLWITFGVNYPSNEDGSPPNIGTGLKKIAGDPDNPGSKSTTTMGLPSGMGVCFAVAFHGGAWIAAGADSWESGAGVAALSTDSGETWTKVFTGSAGSIFTAVAGGARKKSEE